MVAPDFSRSAIFLTSIAKILSHGRSGENAFTLVGFGQSPNYLLKQRKSLDTAHG
jgi:hypothetical protein